MEHHSTDAPLADPELDAVLDGMSEGYLALDENDVVRRVNPAAARLLGVPARALIGEPLGNALPDALQAAVGPVCDEARKTGRVIRRETPDAPGERWLDIRVHPRHECLDVFFNETAAHQRGGENQRLVHELHAERTRLQAVLNQMPAGLTIVDASTGRLLLFNPTAEQLLGHPPLDVHAQADWSVYGGVHSDGRAYRAEEYPIAKAIAGERVQGELLRYRRGDGTLIVLKVNAGPIFDADGNIAAAVTTFYDVTAETQSEMQVADAARFPDENPSPVLRVDEGGTLLYSNRISRLILRSLDLKAGKPAPAIVRQAVAECLRSDMIRELELSVGDRVLSFLLAPVPERGYVNLYGRDMTEWRAAQAELRQSEARFREVLLQSPHPLMVFTDDGRVQLVSRTWTQLTGFAADELLTVRDWTSRAHPEWAEEVEATIEQVFNEQAPRHTGEYIIQTRSGAERMWDFTAVPLGRLPKGRRLMVLMAVDVTDRKAAEDAADDARAAAEDARHAAESASAAKDRFLAMLSHELRTPLTPVMMALGMLANRPDLDDSLRRDLGMMRRNLDLEARLIDDLLDLSRILNGKMTLRLQPLSMHDVCRQVIQSMQPDLDAARLRLVSDLSASPDTIQADAARIHQVLSNLLRNAVKFTPPNAKITVGTFTRDERLHVEVRDEGCGIEPACLQQLFEPFFQGTGTVRERLGGLGLGLSIARAIVELHGGQITANSEGPGRGATFAISLPLVDDRVNTPLIDEPEAPLVTSRPVRVLVVEDHRDTLALMKRLLIGAGFDVTAADCFNAAIAADEAARKAGRPVELLVSDFDLPDGNGCDLIRRLKAADPSLLGLVLSGFGMESDVKRCLEAGFSEHLTKPVDIRQVSDTLKRLALQRLDQRNGA
ncbi:MAG: PAS domain S-box protein [Phycisphaerae bacterium]